MKTIIYSLIFFLTGCSEPSPRIESPNVSSKDAVNYPLKENRPETGEEFIQTIDRSGASERGEESPVSETSPASNEFVSHEKVPIDWFDQQSDFVRGKIEKGEFVLSTVSGEIRVGVATEKGEFITWPGSQVMPSGGSTGYLFFRPSSREPIRF